MRVVNLWGGPGSGKSTTRAGIFHRLKMKGLKVEECTEYAKELTYAGALTTLSDQWYVTGVQNSRLRNLRGRVDYAVSDSPLPLGIVYSEVCGNEFSEPWFAHAVWSLFDGYDNVNVFLERAKPYQTFGRSQTEDQARIVDSKLRRLAGHRIDLFVPGDEKAVDRIVGFLGL